MEVISTVRHSASLQRLSSLHDCCPRDRQGCICQLFGVRQTFRIVRKRTLFAGYGQRHLPDVRVLVLLDAAGGSTVGRPGARSGRSLPQPASPRRRPERARPGRGGGILRRWTGVGVAAAAALAATGRRSGRCVVV